MQVITNFFNKYLFSKPVIPESTAGASRGSRFLKHGFESLDPRLRGDDGQSGRSLLEMLGLLAIGAIIAVGAAELYTGVRTRQARFVAEQDLRELAENARLLYAGRRNYTGITKNFLIKAGALRTETIMGQSFRIHPNTGGHTFSIIFDSMNFSDCAFFATKRFDWAYAVAINGFTTHARTMCAELHPNRVEFIIR